MILVTGGAGFLGNHISKALLDAGEGVVILDDLSGGCRENIDPRALFVEASITNTPLVDGLFAGLVDSRMVPITHVIHAAAYAAEGLSPFIRHFNYTNNLLGSVNLINAAIRHECQCFVFLSSIAVYGNAPTPMHEEMIPCPIDPYGIAKYAVELDLAAAQSLFGLNYIIFRPHNVYGEGQNIHDPY